MAQVCSSRYPDKIAEGISTIEGSLLGLLALLLSFTFSMSATRYDNRRQVLMDEANAIRSAILNADLYLPQTKMAFHRELKPYVQSRIDYWNAGTDHQKRQAALNHGNWYGRRLWKIVGTQAQNYDLNWATEQMSPAIIQMLNHMAKREQVENATIPESLL